MGDGTEVSFCGLRFESQEKLDEALADLQQRLDRITEAERQAWNFC